MLFIEPTLLLCRHNAGTVFIRPISASHSRTDCWRLPVCELRRFLHRNNPVCCEYCGVCVPVAASPQQDNRANGMKPPAKDFFSSPLRPQTNRGDGNQCSGFGNQSFPQPHVFKILLYRRGQVIPVLY